MRVAAWLAGVILVVSACSGGSDDDDNGAARPTSSTAGDTSAAEGLEINLNDNYFDPKVVTGTGGQAVTFKLVNRGTTSHNFSVEEQHIDTDVKQGQSASVKVTFPGNGELVFFCKFHKDEAGMVGTLKVA